MSTPYRPFPIMGFPTGINTYLKEWIRPTDAFQPLTNAYVNRGTINKRAGYTQFGNTVADTNPIMGIMRYIDQTTGAVSLVVATTVNLYLYSAGSNTFGPVMMPPTFTGNITNFFNYTNWQATSGGTSYLWMVNNKDAVTNFDGTTANQPTITIDGAAQTIDTALDVQVYKQRLLLIRPVLSADGIQNQSIYWSANSDPTSWRVDVAGAGGFLAAPTGDIIQSTEFIRDVLVVFFTNSTWIFRYTGNESAPFRWDKVNNSKSTNAPYASVDYDERCTSIGATGLIACDGTNVQRYDIPIIDFYETNFFEKYFAQAFSQRYDNLNQAWTLFVSRSNIFPLVGAVAPGSDSALIYNFLENSWATYTFPIPLTCLGTFYRQAGATWASLAQSWDDTDFAWNSYYSQSTAPILLAGDTGGKVYLMDDGDAVVDDDGTANGASIVPDIVSTRWNPMISQGQQLQFGWVDIYYLIASTDPLNPISVNINFYVDNSENIAATKVLTLDGPTSSEYAIKRVYLNLIGEFIQMEIDPQNMNAFMQFLGFILWMRPGGRLTPA